jgi:hypothetical protein
VRRSWQTPDRSSTYRKSLSVHMLDVSDRASSLEGKLR